MITDTGGQGRAGFWLDCRESGKGFMAALTLLYGGVETATGGRECPATMRRTPASA
ncbi:hypothetical protein Msi02_41540 [Microbispora siamensis]|uniref:Uncharacterized protein n=1 Tax=Microbispora siamensis TaxID=564413 RepID=A0ABQ4GPH7_9ACTN|nr:hypothetical protein Mro03_03120 [Microbispora rosea subsp. rosea]GIH63337.1 hypothetical protein Msi02_41540 [Microbispora siamensis]GLX04286.1 hypothetical protein Misp03_12130 [Microbispora sp. NBRC 16548]